MADPLIGRRRGSASRQDSTATNVSQATNATQEPIKSPPVKYMSLQSVPESARNNSVDQPTGMATTSPINDHGQGLDHSSPDTYAIGATHGIASAPSSKPPDRKSNRRSHRNAAETIKARFAPAKRSRVWDTYVKKTEEEDKDLAEDWDRVIDVTLVFAALFSAIVTGFVLESSKNLQIDQSEASVSAIRDLTSVVRAGFNGSTAASSLDDTSSEESFKPTTTTVWVNCLWFLSLGVSISVSIFAMLAKRWCYVFRSKRVGTSYERAMKRQESWDAIEQWKIELIVEQLPTLMHMALMLFFIGLVVYLSEIHRTTMVVTAALVGFTLVLYFLLTILPLWYQTCPMITPFTRIVLGMRWYAKKLHKLGKKKAQLLPKLETDIRPSNIFRSRIRLPSRQDSIHFVVLAFKGTPVFVSTKLDALWKQVDTTLGSIFSSLGQTTSLSSNPDWVLARCSDPTSANTMDWSPRERNKHAFGALSWILHNSKDKDSIKEVLDYVVSFPEVILDSSANSKELYEIASKTAEHLNRFHHDAAEWRHTLHFKTLCARLIFLTARPWLHQSTEDGSTLSKIEDLAEKFKEINISPQELNSQIAAIKTEKVIELSDPILWMEDLAGKIVLGCTPESGLKLCSTLVEKLLENQADLRARGLNAEVYPTLWWIFLNNVVNCFPHWPHSQSQDWPQHETAVDSDSMLTFTHFRDLRKRQESALWLRIVGISGMLYAFTRHPRHDDSPAFLRNKQYFVNLINILHASLRVTLTGTSDPFIGELPVYHDTEIRLYQFDSLHYAFDALRFSVESSVYRDAPFLDDLRNLLHDIRQLRRLKRLFDPVPGCDLDHGLVEQRFKNETQTNYAPDILLASGMQRYIPDGDYRLTRKRAKLLSRVLPSIIFGAPGAHLSTYDPDEYLGAMLASASDRYIEATDMIAAWAWMPFRYDSDQFRKDFRVKSSNEMPVGPIWQSLHRAGLLDIPLRECSASVFYFYNMPKESPARTYGYCLFIKASLLERLYSFPCNGSRLLGVLEWSIALSKHMTVLLQFWDAASMTWSEQAYIITSLMHLVDVLFESAPSPGTALPNLESPTSTTRAEHGVAAWEQLKELVESGIISIFSRPFCDGFEFEPAVMIEQIPNEVVWHDKLARLIDKLARTFPRQREEGKDLAESEYNMLKELLCALGKGRETGEDTDHGEGMKPYSNLVAYYEARARMNGGEPPQMLGTVRDLWKHMNQVV